MFDIIDLFLFNLEHKLKRVKKKQIQKKQNSNLLVSSESKKYRN